LIKNLDNLAHRLVNPVCSIKEHADLPQALDEIG